LRDAGISNLSKSDPGVSFLRRTEYIAEKQAVATPISNGNTNKNEKSVEHTDPESQLKAVEATFDIAQETLTDLSKLSHPKKKHLKAVNAWPLLPDTSMLDTKYLNLRFVGSASINREIQQAKSQPGFDEELQKDLLKSTIFRPITSEDGEWLSLFQLKETSKSKELLGRLNSTEKEQPVNLLDEDEDKEVYPFKHVKNYDMKFQRFSKPNEELAIKLIPESSSSKKRKAAYYYPVTGRIDLKKYRVSTNREVARFLKESTIDQINFLLREPTTNELKKMDTIRSEYDPMEYEGEEDEEEEGVHDEEGDEQNEPEEQDVATEFNDASKEAEVGDENDD